MKHLFYYALAALLLLSGVSYGQTLMPLPPHSNIYSGTVRGYWFVAPTSFNIVGLRVSPDAGAGDQYIHVMRINDPVPVLYPTASTNFTTLAYISAAPNSVMQTVNIPVNTGDIIGILGAAGTGTNNSYSGSVTPYATTIGGFPVNLSRLLYQGAITSGPAPNYSTEGSPYPISRVEMYYITGPPCPVPNALNVTNITSSTATVSWGAVTGSVGYDYVVDQTPTSPGSSTGVINTTNTSAPIPGLTENTWYYVHIRSLCAGNEVSAWGLDSFLTPIVCRPPQISIDHINVDEAVAYWDAIPTAYEYEYAITQSATPPALGTVYKFTSLHTSALKDGVDYYIHVRSHCESVEIKSVSDWGTASFKTFPTSVSTTGGDEFGLTCYPNPVTSVMHLSLKGKVKGEPVVTITDVSGKVLQKFTMSGDEMDVNMDGFAKGIYIVKYADAERNGTIHITKQ